MSKMPLFDGSTVDIGRSIGPEVDDGGTQSVALREDFASGELPWWLDYETDSGPTTPTINGLGTSGGMTDVELETGSDATSGDATNLVGPSIDLRNWAEVRFYVWGQRASHNNGEHTQVMLSDASTYPNVTEGFVNYDADDWPRIFQRVITGGEEINSQWVHDVDVQTRHMTGFDIYDYYDNPGSEGHNIDFIYNQKPYNRWYDGSNVDEDNWPDMTQNLTFRVGIATLNGDQRSLTLDGIYIELLPYLEGGN